MHVLTVPSSRRLLLALAIALALAAAMIAVPSTISSRAEAGGHVAPHWEVDPFWPKPLPSNWRVGQVAGIDVDQHDRIWIVQRPGSLTGADLMGTSPAPPVMAFDPQGNLLYAWGPEAADPAVPGPRDWHGCEWPRNEHGIWVDDDDNVWIGGNGGGNHVVLKLSTDGSECLLQIGQWGVPGNNDSTDLLNQPADGDTDDENRLVYIADGYGSTRVAIFDMDTGEFRGRILAPPGFTFSNPVHCSVLADDGLLYVCDRPNSRMFVYDTDGMGGATFVDVSIVAPNLPIGGLSLMDIDFTHDRAQAFLVTADGLNQHIHVMSRANPHGDPLSTFGRGGRMAGQFQWVHNLATDSRGNLYTAEVSEGKRAQKWDRRGFRPVK